jgi:hypothetical protein
MLVLFPAHPFPKAIHAELQSVHANPIGGALVEKPEDWRLLQRGLTTPVTYDDFVAR